MKQVRFLSLLLPMVIMLTLFQHADAHFKARYHVVVDTDGGEDDFLALCMMLASPEIEVMAVTTVQGVLSPEETASRVLELLRRFGHEGIPVGVHAAADLIACSVENEEMPVDIVALGPLTNLAEVLRSNPGFDGRIRRIYWSGNGQDRKDPNLQLDRSAAETVFQSGIPLTGVSAGLTRMNGGTSMPDRFTDPVTRYSKAVSELILENAGAWREMAHSGGDACVPLYMLYPEHFVLGSETEAPAGQAGQTASQAMQTVSLPTQTASLAPGTETWPLVREVLESDIEDKSIIFSRFPVDPGMFEPDVAAITGALIERHGLKEWKIVVLTNEFHEHLGIYSIMGAKMGLRAREYFHVGIDELTIQTSAGSTPPVSCLNDGLQASTGGTLGHGTITLAEGEVTPSARFTFKDRTVELVIRPGIRERIRGDVGYGVKTFGLDSPEYWTYIRELALKYWLEMNRFDIFEIREL